MAKSPYKILSLLVANQGKRFLFSGDRVRKHGVGIRRKSPGMCGESQEGWKEVDTDHQLCSYFSVRWMGWGTIGPPAIGRPPAKGAYANNTSRRYGTDMGWADSTNTGNRCAYIPVSPVRSELSQISTHGTITRSSRVWSCPPHCRGHSALPAYPANPMVE